MTSDSVKVGSTTIFLQSSAFELLKRIQKRKIQEFVIKVQAAARRSLALKYFRAKRFVTLWCQRHCRGHTHRVRYKLLRRKLNAAIIIQCATRCVQAKYSMEKKLRRELGITGAVPVQTQQAHSEATPTTEVLRIRMARNLSPETTQINSSNNTTSCPSNELEGVLIKVKEKRMLIHPQLHTSSIDAYRINQLEEENERLQSQVAVLHRGAANYSRLQLRVEILEEEKASLLEELCEMKTKSLNGYRDSSMVAIDSNQGLDNAQHEIKALTKQLALTKQVASKEIKRLRKENSDLRQGKIQKHNGVII